MSPSLLSPQQAFERLKSVFPNLESIDNDTFTEHMRQVIGVPNIDWGDLTEWPPKEPEQKWRIFLGPTDLGKSCKLKTLGKQARITGVAETSPKHYEVRLDFGNGRFMVQWYSDHDILVIDDTPSFAMEDAPREGWLQLQVGEDKWDVGFWDGDSEWIDADENVLKPTSWRPIGYRCDE